MAGVVVVEDHASEGAAPADLGLLAEAIEPREWEGRVLYAPL